MPSQSQLLEKYGLTYEQLNQAERETLNQWAKLMSTKQLMLSDVKTQIASLIRSVEKELALNPETQSLWSLIFRRDNTVYLKARLGNYLMLQDFLEGPDRAQKWIEAHIQQATK